MCWTGIGVPPRSSTQLSFCEFGSRGDCTRRLHEVDGVSVGYTTVDAIPIEVIRYRKLNVSPLSTAQLLDHESAEMANVKHSQVWTVAPADAGAQCLAPAGSRLPPVRC